MIFSLNNKLPALLKGDNPLTLQWRTRFMTFWKRRAFGAFTLCSMAIRVMQLLILLWVPAAVAAPRTFNIDGNASTAAAHIGKTGIASFAGHEHTVVARTIQGEVVFDADDLPRSSVDLIVDARSLKVSEEGEPGGDAAKVQAVMRGPSVLDVARYATVHFRAEEVSGKQTAPGSYELALHGELSLHGIARRFKVPVRLDVRGQGLTASGSLVLNQTDFGIEPTSAAGGLVKVENEVKLTFRIVARASIP